MATLEEIYTKEWFEHDFRYLRAEFHLAAVGLDRQFRPKSVLDVGCGPGMLLEGFPHRVHTLGIEGSNEGIRYAKDSGVGVTIRHLDLRYSCLPEAKNTFPDPEVFDLVVCTEVLEHIEEEHAAKVVQYLCRAGGVIVVSAAPPGQDGHYHVNCRDWGSYWAPLFLAHGVIQDLSATWDLQIRWGGLQRLSHMTRNVRVMK